MNQNAMTTAEAQAFKRAASCFGLGRYLYNLAGDAGSRSQWASASRPASRLFPTGRFRKLVRQPVRPTRPAVRGPGSPTWAHRSENHGQDRRLSAHSRRSNLRRDIVACRANAEGERHPQRTATDECRRGDGTGRTGNPQGALPGRVDRRYAIRLRARSLAHRVDDNNQQSRSTQASGFGTRRTGWATCRLNAEESCSTSALSARRRHTHGADDIVAFRNLSRPLPCGLSASITAKRRIRSDSSD